MQLYAITDRSLLGLSDDGGQQPGPEVQDGLATLARSWAEGGVSYIQIREKDLSSDALAALSEALVAATRGFPVHILVNGTPRVAAAAGAAGVHLPAGWTAEAISAARNVFQQRNRKAILSVACHSSAETVRARDLGADLALLSPVFEKRLRQDKSLLQREESPRPKPAETMPNPDPDAQARRGMGLAAFREACALAAPLPVFALGGVTVANAGACVEAGAAGIAAIRLFMGKAAGWRTL